MLITNDKCPKWVKNIDKMSILGLIIIIGNISLFKQK